MIAERVGVSTQPIVEAQSVFKERVVVAAVLFGFYFCLLETYLGVVKDSDLLSSDRAESWVSGVTDNILRAVYWVTD